MATESRKVRLSAARALEGPILPTVPDRENFEARLTALRKTRFGDAAPPASFHFNVAKDRF